MMLRGSRILRILLFTIIGGFLVFTLEHILLGSQRMVATVVRMDKSPTWTSNSPELPDSGGKQSKQQDKVLPGQSVQTASRGLPGLPVSTGSVVVPTKPHNNGNVVVPTKPHNNGDVVVPTKPHNNGDVVVPIRPGNPWNIPVTVRPEDSGEPMQPETTGKVVVPVQPVNYVTNIQNSNQTLKLNGAFQKLVDSGVIQRSQLYQRPDVRGSLLNFLFRTSKSAGGQLVQTQGQGETDYPGGHQQALLQQLRGNEGVVSAANAGGNVVQQHMPLNNPEPTIGNNYETDQSRQPVIQLGGGERIGSGLETKILRWNGTGWMQLHRFCAGNFGFKRTVLKSPVGNAMINIHELSDDKYVSGSLNSFGLWDLVDITTMVNNLRADPELGFIDIGSHVGTFSIVAAIMGRKVVAVDPLVSNVLRFCKSIQENNFTDKVTIFYTAISNGYRTVTFQRDLGNIGGTRIIDTGTDVNITNVFDPNYINTVPLDEILSHIPFKKAFVKMDVEEHEYQVITSGKRFFNELDIRGILMEWMWQKTGASGRDLRDYLLQLGFIPFVPNSSDRLQPESYRIWPNDVLWKKI